MNENSILPIIFVIVFFIGFLIGASVVHTEDTYDCTVKCPNNSHSIFFDNACYCKVGE